MNVDGCAIIADISGSTPLYDAGDTQKAFETISARVDRLRQQAEEAGGEFIHSKGDDVLAFFEDPDAGVEAAKKMISNDGDDFLTVHAGVCWGSILRTEDDMFGPPVNIAARLSSLARPLEALVSQTCFERLTPHVRATLQTVDRLRLKGVADDAEVHSFMADDFAERTFLDFGEAPARALPVRVTLRHLGAELQFSEEARLKIGRADGNGLVISSPWVSRNHATLVLKNGLVELRDHSTGGSFVTLMGNTETPVRRSSMTLTGSGIIALGAPRMKAGKSVVAFSVEDQSGNLHAEPTRRPDI